MGDDDIINGMEGGTAEAELLRLADFDPRHPGRIMTELRAYWDSLRNGRAVPARGDIEPRGMRNLLGHAFILERIAPGAARFRLAGRHLIDLMGMEVRGMPLCSFFNPTSRGHLSDVMETVFAGPQIAELSLVSEGAYARPPLAARMLLLPLKSDLGDVTRALGAVIAAGEIGRPPRRFDLTGEVLTPVIEGARPLTPTPSAAGFAEPPATWELEIEPEKTRPARPDPAPGTAEARRASFRVIPGGQK